MIPGHTVTLLGYFIFAIATIVFSIAHPALVDAAVVGTLVHQFRLRTGEVVCKRSFKQTRFSGL